MKTKSTFFCLAIIFFVNTCVTAYSQAVDEQDSLALVDLYNSTNGSAWDNNNNWLSGPVRTWYGITVTGTRVTGINLSFNNLEGNIPTSIGNIVNLTTFYLFDNQLNGSIPSSLGNLVNLINLSLYNNQLSGRIPTSFGNLLSLNFLKLGGNQLSGSIPSSLGNLANLSHLSMGFNQLSGVIPSSLGNLVNLGDLFLDNNQLSGSIPSSLGNLVNLSTLYLNNNQLSGKIPSSLGNLVNLYFLDLSNNELSGSIPSSFGNLVNLEHLFLGSNRLSGIPSSFATLPALYELDLSKNRFTFDGIELLAQTILFFTYNNQARIPVHQNGSALSVSAGGTLSNNTYRWFRVKKTGITLVTTIAGDSVFHPAENGVYGVRVVNSIATDLILYSSPIKYLASENNTQSLTSKSKLEANDKIHLFLVYPNPAKDILHIETHSNESFSLLNQSGQILLTTNIKGKGSINISGIAPGLYYLKNSSTGAVKKVVVSK